MSKGTTIKTKSASTRRQWLALSIMAIALVLSTPLMAGAPLPDIPHPKGKGDKCVEDTEFMRKNHYVLLLHQRDQTMHLGIRTKKHSLKECIDCHAVYENGKPVSVASPKHFCRECHDYASVNIDCFDCHASKPRMNKAANTSMPSAMMHQDLEAKPMSPSPESQPADSSTEKEQGEKL